MLTTEQQATLKADILADPVLAAYPNTTDGAYAIAALYDQQATPAFYVWKSSVSVNEIMGNGFAWTLVDNLGVGKARIWEWMTSLGTINISQANVRAGVLACFAGGTGGFPEMRTSVFGHGQRMATRAEKLFATGTGVVSNDQGVGPATMAVEGTLSYMDVFNARNS